MRSRPLLLPTFGLSFFLWGPNHESSSYIRSGSKAKDGEKERERNWVITMASYALQRNLGWRTQSRLGQKSAVRANSDLCRLFRNFLDWKHLPKFNHIFKEQGLKKKSPKSCFFITFEHFLNLLNKLTQKPM